MEEQKTSTFTIHHDRCKPETWTPCDVLVFADFIRTGSMLHAAALARLGVQLILSEHHVPKGGALEEIGWLIPGDKEQVIYPELHEAIEAAGDDDVTELAPVYRGPAEYVVKVPIGDDEGTVEGYEHEIKPTRDEADALARHFYSREDA